MAFPTPSFAHLKEEDYENVYEPAEDTFLMMDALEKDADFLKERRYNGIVRYFCRLEICGHRKMTWLVDC